MIFRVFTIYKGIKKGTKDPSGFAQEEAFELLRSLIMPLTVIGAIFVVLFFLLGYSSFWFGPSGFFKVMSIITSVAWLGWFLITRVLLMFAKRMLRHAKQKVDSKIFHHDVTPK